MFSAIPMPNIDNMSIQAKLGQLNELQQQRLQNSLLGWQNKYAPITIPAEAASKLTYANLMGPQFLAKLMGNENILANIPDDKKQQALNLLYNVGSGQGYNNALTQLPNQDSSPLHKLVNNIKSAFGFGESSPASIPTASPNSSPTNALSYPIQENQDDIKKASLAWLQSPEGQAQAKQEGIISIPEKNQLMNWYHNQNSLSSNQLPQKTYAENVGQYKGVVEEGKEAGKIRAKDIKDLNDVVFNAQTKQATLDDINNMISSPEIREIRQLPLAGRHEMGFYAKEGTPAQQQLVGRIYSQMGNIVKDSARDFAGQFRRGEQQLLQGMKPNDSDTVDAMIGKSESLSVMNKMLLERAKLTSQYMNQYHMNKGQAQELADDQVDGDSIRQQVHNQLNPKPTDEDIKFMANKYKVSEDEIKKRLKNKGII